MKTEGIWGCTVLAGKLGKVDGITTVQIDVQIADGPDKGQRCTYEEIVNAKSAKYVGWSCTAVGWKGPSLSTFEAECAAWIEKTGGTTTVEIQHLEMKKGKAVEKWENEGRQGPRPVWDKVKGIGRGMARAMAPIDTGSLKDADDVMRGVMGGDEDSPF